jgi:nucleotide-binding universal stress UspA family protein
MPTEPREPVVVGVDGGDAALDLAAGVAAARCAPLTLIHAVDLSDPTDAARAAARAAQARRRLAAATDRVRATYPTLMVTATLAQGEPATALIRGATLIHRPFDASSRRGQRPIVVGLTDPDSADVLLECAFEEARSRGVPLVGIHGPCPAYAAVPAGSGVRSDTDPLAAAVTRWRDKYPTVPVRTVVRPGVDVVVTVGAASHTADLAVVAAPRANERTGGSVSAALLHRSGCPVLAVPLP